MMRKPEWPRDYEAECNCNPPEHSPDQINADKSFHSRTCPVHPSAKASANQLNELAGGAK